MYAEVFRDYADRSWTPLPLPAGKKSPPPKGYTGYGHPFPAYGQMQRWAIAQPGANVALPLPDTVIGIDVDAYHDGLSTLRKLIDRLGEPPDGPWSSSGREDGSGIFYFQVQAGLHFVSAIPEGIEIVQRDYRYAVVWPSIHPDTGLRYRWHDTDGIPWPDGLPWLPDSWVRELTSTPNMSGKGFTGSAEEWLSNLPSRRLSGLLARDYNRRVRNLEMKQGSRHPSMVRTVNWLVHCGAEGHNVRAALDDLRETYITALKGERNGEYEFNSALEWAISHFGIAG